MYNINITALQILKTQILKHDIFFPRWRGINAGVEPAVY